MDQSPQAVAPVQERMLEEAPAAPFRAGVSRIDRLRQRFWATRVRLLLHLRRDRGDSTPRRRAR